MTTSPAIDLQGVSCTFISKDDPGQRYTAVRDVTLTVGAGEFVSVVGPTGCGKSTLLNVAAGLLAPSTGYVPLRYYNTGQALDVTITKAKGRPMLTGVGKKPLARVRAYPALADERYDATSGQPAALHAAGGTPLPACARLTVGAFVALVHLAAAQAVA